MQKLKMTITEEIEPILFTNQERNIIDYCLAYCLHRINKHHKSGMECYKMKAKQIEELKNDIKG